VGMHRRRRIAIERVGGVDEKKLGARRLRGRAVAVSYCSQLLLAQPKSSEANSIFWETKISSEFSTHSCSWGLPDQDRFNWASFSFCFF
jgi:hypothetical protein